MVVVRAADVLGGRRVVRRDSGDIRHADRRLAIPARDRRTSRHRHVPRVLRESTTNFYPRDAMLVLARVVSGGSRRISDPAAPLI